MINGLIRTLIVSLVVVLFSSCYSLKKSIYLDGDLPRKLNDIDGTFLQNPPEYKVEVNDLLYIRVTSLDEQTSAFLNNESGYTNMPESASATSLLGYRVDMDGSIEYPFIGKIFVAGLTLEEIRDKLTLAVSRYLEQSNVIVKQLNDNITVIGEVNMPGRFPLNSEKINIIEALSLAGDLTDFGNRKKVRLIRHRNEIPQMFIIDITDERTIYSQYFWLQPGDIIYVEPRPYKALSLNTTFVTAGVSMITATFAILTYLNSREEN
ncbi:polysaccharide biosynthesis/export family protein [Marinilabilia salmonicolor]|jgi:polysaccharide export outer membrane protein|uniref:Polysaccharide export outer membrane protein n=1 Tax=Marinilabilia salmonicolor TaxID=989 RepID=A0A2T0XEU0_9BACT|nr:polysaccharide biosynthesis/export family protein [Marinilabilia salmonicolor]PRY97400.1 polysaccharide export outer membrane protein [Marinilabilia salmonicolor]RCW35371.1 polysaccharide export outer membrane protein [Marinilabilia salmonicolor]